MSKITKSQERIDGLTSSSNRIKEYTTNFYDKIKDDIEMVHSLTKTGVDEAERFVDLLLLEYSHRQDSIGEAIHDLGANIYDMRELLEKGEAEELVEVEEDPFGGKGYGDSSCVDGIPS